jgi:hypothetical protein
MKRESKIKKLLDKFLEGETSLKEEQVLADYFRNEDINPEWSVYKDMFGYFEESQKDVPQKSFSPQSQVSLFYKLQKYAAILMIALISTLFYYNHTTSQKELGTFDDPEVALQETKKVFDLISYHLNSPSDEMKYLQTLEETQTKYINKLTP